MTKRPYHIQKPNATAVCILRNWLEDIGASVSLSPNPQIDLIVSDRLNVIVGQEQKQVADTVFVKNTDFTGKNYHQALSAFYFVTDAANIPRQKPSIRDNGLTLNERGNPCKLFYKNEEFLVAIRHNEFRRATNPVDSTWGQYKVVVDQAVWGFLRGTTNNVNHSELCKRHGIEFSDLLSYARCYVVNFCGRYKTWTPVDDDNERKCYEYIKQRFKYDFLPILWRKERSMTPDADTVRIALFGDTYCNTEVSPDPTDAYVYALDNAVAVGVARAALNTPRLHLVETTENGKRKKTRSELEAKRIDGILESFFKQKHNDFKYVDKHCEIDTTSIGARKKSAAAKLTELLGKMSHTQLVETLEYAVQNYALDTPTRREAKKRLVGHISKCNECDVAALDSL